jgi:hypothetical protein
LESLPHGRRLFNLLIKSSKRNGIARTRKKMKRFNKAYDLPKKTGRSKPCPCAPGRARDAEASNDQLWWLIIDLEVQVLYGP